MRLAVPLGILLALALSSCSSSRKKGGGVSAPKDMRSAVAGWKNTIADRVSASNPWMGWAPLAVRQVPTDTKLGKYPVVRKDGRTLGGWYRPTGCGKKGTVYMPTFNGAWSHELLGHEIYHHADQMSRCTGGHPDYLKRAGAPSWPTFTPASPDKVRTDTLRGGFARYVIEEHHRSDGAIIIEIRDRLSDRLSSPALTPEQFSALLVPEL